MKKISWLWVGNILILALGMASENSIVEFKIAIGAKHSLMEGSASEPANQSGDLGQS